MAKRLKKVWRWLAYGILLLLVLLFSLAFLLRIPAVQQYVVNTITDYLSSELKTEVQIAKVHLSFFDDVLFENFYVEDQAGDTLIYAKRLEANFNTGLFALLQKRLELNELTLHHAELNTKRRNGKLVDNLQFIVDYFEQRQNIRPAYKQPSQFVFNVKQVYLYDFRYNRYDELQGIDLQTHIDRGIFDFKEVSIPYLTFDAKSIEIDRPEINIRNFETEWTQVSFDTLLTLPEDLVYPDSSFWTIRMDRLDIEDGYLKLDNDRLEPIKLTPDSILNYRHMEVFDIDAIVNQFQFENKEFQGSIRSLSLRDLSGFELEPSYAEQFFVSKERVELLGLRLQTPHTSLGDTLIFRYKEYADFADFPNKVKMQLNFKESHVRLDDIMTFAPALENNPFFSKNRRLRLNLDGNVNGNINNMSGRGLYVRLQDGSRVSGRFNARDITLPGQQFLNIDFDALHTSMATLRRVLPNFDLPTNFDKLGQLYYTGHFDMVLDDLILEGDLESELGNANLNIQFQRSSKGLEHATYSGKLALYDFDLERWTENKDFGKITLTSEVQEGRGLTGKTADARLKADIQSFEFRGYNYRNAGINGRLNQRLFKGDLLLEDKHIGLDFKGKLDFTKEKPVFDFDAAVAHLHLKPLNLSERDLKLKGNVDLRLENDNPSEMIGSAVLRDFELTSPAYKEHIDSMDIDLKNKDGIRTLSLDSEVLDADITGTFDLARIPDAFLQALHYHFPKYAKRFKLKQPAPVADSTNQFVANIHIKNSGNFTKFFEPKLDTLKDVKLNAYFNDINNELALDLEFPAVTFDTLSVEGGKMLAEFKEKEGTFNVNTAKVTLKNGKETEPIAIRTTIENDDLDFNIKFAPNINNVISQLDINGQILTLDSTTTRVTLGADDFYLLSSKWDLSEDNYIEFGKDKIEVNDFLLADDQGRRIELKAYQDKGLNLLAKGFHFGLIDTFWNYPLLDFGGDFQLHASLDDALKVQGINLGIRADSFLINEENYGNFTLKAEAADLKSSLISFMSIIKDTMQLSVNASYNLPNFESKIDKDRSDSQQPNYMNLQLNTSKYPLAFLEYFLGHSISNTEGTINGRLNLKGFLPEPKVSGYATVLNGATTIDFLQARFYVHDQKAVIDDKCICSNSGIVTDMEGNQAYVNGGITHQFLKNLGLDVNMTTANDKFIALDTKKGDNEVFYGRGTGSGTIWFSGPFTHTDININAVAGKGSKITIPVTYDKEASENRFITFTDPNAEAVDTIVEQANELRGVKMDMDLTLTDVAQVDLVFDEQAGDIIRGRGKGNVQIYLDRTQEFTMFGDYTIEQGEYLFTLFDFVNKPFTVQRGGTITWEGDPFNAIIDLKANYEGLSTPIAGLIQEYLGFSSNRTQINAQTPTEVDLLMHLRGELLKPTIDFDIQFPRLQGNLKTYAETKLRTLREDQNALNRQVFGLIVLGQFIPEEISIDQGGTLINNTVSELLANQLSIILTDFLSEVIGNNKVISNLDVDLAYNRYDGQATINQNKRFLSGEQYQAAVRANVVNDRWVVTVGPKFLTSGTGGNADSQAAYGHDIVLEYIMNEDRTFKLRISNVLEPDIGGGSNQQKTAAGISYEREFDTFEDFWKEMFKKEKKESFEAVGTN